MRIIFRHLLREFLVNLGYCLTAFVMLFVMYDVFDHITDLLASDAPWHRILLYYASLIATSIEFLAPASLLLATLYTLWQLTRTNEIIAMRSSGVSLLRIMQPLLLVGLVFTLLSGAIKELATPHLGFWAMTFAQNDFNEVDEMVYHHHAYYSSTGRRLWIVNEYDLTQPNVLHGLKLTQERADHTRIRDLFALRAEYMDGTWWFYGVQEQAYTQDDQPSGGLHPPAPEPDRVREMPHLDETPAQFALNVKPWMFFSTREMLSSIRANPEISDQAITQKWSDVHYRIASPWACLVVIVFGIPTGIRGGRKNPLIGIFLAIALFFAFYATTQIGIFMGKREIVWPWLSAWLPNLIFFLAGSIMIWRMR